MSSTLEGLAVSGQEVYNTMSHASREEWLRTRAAGIGASDAAAVLGLSPWRSPLEVYAEKIGAPVNQEETSAMRWGLRLEPVVAEAYAEETGRTLEDLGRFTILQSRALPWQLATLDRIITGDPRGLGLLEIKTANAFAAGDWSDGPPAHYWIQVQHQLAVSGFAWASVAVLIGGQDFRWCDVARDEAAISELVAREASFWRRVQTLNPPPADGSASCTGALAALYRRQEERFVQFSEELEDMDAEREQLVAGVDSAATRIVEIENTIRAAIGDATGGVFPNSGASYTWKANKNGSRVLRRHEPKGGRK